MKKIASQVIVKKRSIGLLTLILVLTSISTNLFAQEFKPNGKMYGYVFGDLFSKIQSDSTAGKLNIGSGNSEFVNMKKDFTGFSIRRAYLGYQYNFSPNFTTKVLLEGSDGVTTSGGDRTVFIKIAEVEWKNLIPRASLFIGQTATPAYSMNSEKIWAYRSVEKTISDMQKMIGSADAGIRLTGTFDSASNFGYSVMIGNGRGAKPEDKGNLKLSGNVNAQFLQKKLYLELYGDYEKIPSKYPTGGLIARSTIKGFASYKTPKFTIGFEVPYQVTKDNKINTNPTTLVKDTTEQSTFGLSFFAHGKAGKNITIFGRFDSYQADHNYKFGDNSRSYNENFMTFGFDWAPHKNMHIIPNIYITTYKDKRAKPTVENSSKYYARKADITPRITYYFIF